MLNLNEWALRFGVSPLAVQALRGMLTPDAPSGGEAGVSESSTQKKIRLASNYTGGLMLRNNSGVANEVRRDGSTRPVRYGLGNDSRNLNQEFKSSDLIGLTPVEIKTSHLGLTLGVFTAVEVKAPGWDYKGTQREIAQNFFINTIRSRGGLGGFATGAEDYLRICKCLS